MDVGTVLSAAQTLFAALQCSELKEVLSIFNYESQLDDLQGTVKAITASLRDAKAQQELSNEAQNWIEELRDVVFEADDLFDEFVTLAQQKKLLKANGSLSKKVSSFFSSSKNSVSLAYKMSRGIKDIKKKLDAIVYNSQFSFKLDSEPIRQRRQETCSYVNEVDIIGREHDLESIVGTLLDSNVQRDVSFLSIVGIGGLGKTALAQLVYNDPRVTSAFPLRMWACVSDQDQKQLDVKEILLKMLDKNPDGFTMDKVQIQLREQLAHKKYLLVLDDVWTEKRDQWHALANLLIGGQRGSWVVVTTRSEETSRIIDDAMYKLQGLSDENSWMLFHKTAFGPQQSNPPNDLVKIGQEIVVKCAQVPLAIKVVGSLLYGQGKNKWLSFRNVGLANIRESQNDIMPILKLSYHHLESPLKSCLAFCALFPKDFVMEKTTLISLWMAQGYIVPLDEGQSIEDAGEEYFLILTRRCFLQDIEEDEDGEIISCKIHDLMHDIAQKVSGKEICSTNSFCGNLDKKVRHLYLTGIKGGKHSFHKTRIRSIFLYGRQDQQVNMDQIMAKESLANCMWLRALHLSWSNIKSLPESIGQLLHLRYLDLSGNHEMELLPKSITKLYNLETLVLSWCSSLKELPKDLHRLVKLRDLDIMCISRLEYMPRGMGKLSCLNSLSNFIVGGEGSYANWKQWFYALDDLKALDKLKGSLAISIFLPKDDMKFDEEDGMMKGLYLRSKEHLNDIELHFRSGEVGRMDDEGIIRLMEELQPHPNLRRLSLSEYQSAKLPSWVAILINLVQLRIEYCYVLEYLSPLGYLHHLKELKLLSLPELEYVFEDCPRANSCFMPDTSTLGVVEQLEFFPALERLWLCSMPKLKGWKRGIEVVDDNNSNKAQLQLVRFFQLKSLTILYCSQLTSIIMCPSVEKLELFDFNENLQIITNSEREEKLGELPPSSSRMDIVVPNLKVLQVNNFAWLNSLPIEAFHHLEKLSITEDTKVESLEEVEKVFRGCSSSLRCLRIERCFKLKNVVYRGLEHLVALQELHIRNCSQLRLEEEQERGDGIGIGILPWKSLHHSLRYMCLTLLPLEKLPDGMQYLTSLQVLDLRSLKCMKSMPNWMPKLTNLRILNLWEFSESLKQRCQKDPPGEDWPYIQQIPNIEHVCWAVLE